MARRPVIVVVEDSLMHRLAWKQWLEGCSELVVCAGPRQFWNTMRGTPGLLERVDCVITDYFFDAFEDDADAPEDDDEADNGVELARRIKSRRPGVIVLLASGVEGLDHEGVLDGSIAKAPAPKESAYATLERLGVLPP